MDMK
jgi:hypothetical protein